VQKCFAPEAAISFAHTSSDHVNHWYVICICGKARPDVVAVLASPRGLICLQYRAATCCISL
jgi:hypothetical protein